MFGDPSVAAAVVVVMVVVVVVVAVVARSVHCLPWTLEISCALSVAHLTC